MRIRRLAAQCNETESLYCDSVITRHVEAQDLSDKPSCDTYRKLLLKKLRICDEAGTVDESEVRSLLIPLEADSSYRLVHGQGSLGDKEAV
jgi:hypothetical protein